MKQYAAMFRIRFTGGLQYRAAALAGIATQFGFGFMFISQYLAFYRTNPSAFPMEIAQVVSYIWIQQAFLALFMTWFFEYDIFASITTGHISYDLARPMDLYGKWFFQCTASRLSKAVLRCFPIILIAMILPEPYKLILPPDLNQLLLFILSTSLTLCIVVAFQMLIYISAFYTMSAGGVRLISAVLTDFMAGSIVPLPFFPDRFRRIAEWLPFAAMQNMPLRIYNGNISDIDALNGILFQLFWLIVLLFIGKLWLNGTLKRVIVQGG